MAKATDEKKGAPAEELVEKPREPLFSPMGMMIMLGSNLAVAVLVLIVVMSLTGGDDPKDAGKASGTGTQEENIQFHVLQGMQALVSGAGDERATVRFSLLLSFEGAESDQTNAINYFKEANREKELEVQAIRAIKAHTINSIEDTNFDDRFGEELLEKLNALKYPFRFRSVLLHSKSIQKR